MGPKLPSGALLAGSVASSCDPLPPGPFQPAPAAPQPAPAAPQPASAAPQPASAAPQPAPPAPQPAPPASPGLSSSDLVSVNPPGPSSPAPSSVANPLAAALGQAFANNDKVVCYCCFYYPLVLFLTISTQGQLPTINVAHCQPHSLKRKIVEVVVCFFFFLFFFALTG